MYSQNNEDDILMSYFSAFKPESMNLLDIGANDGKTFSNSLRLIECGWSATLVEPSPLAFSQLEKLHSSNERVKLCNFGISDKTEIADFYESGGYKGGCDIALYSTAKPSEMDRWGDSVKFNKTAVQFKSWEDFLLENNCPLFDFISIDVEGLDLQLLTGIDLAALKCKCVCVEWNSIEHNEIAMSEYCTKFGMKLILKNAENLIFAL